MLWFEGKNQAENGWFLPIFLVPTKMVQGSMSETERWAPETYIYDKMKLVW